MDKTSIEMRLKKLTASDLTEYQSWIYKNMAFYYAKMKVSKFQFQQIVFPSALEFWK